MSGYLHPEYAASLGGDDAVLNLADSGGRLIARAIPGTEFRDAMAPYPFLVCSDWGGLPADMARLPSDLVSVTAVTDPFATVDVDVLTKAFNHLVRPYKLHFEIDLTRPLASFADPHHLGCARRALKKLDVEYCPDPAVNIGEWTRLYANLVARHDIRGAALMDEQTFHRQLRIPGLTQFRAVLNGVTIGMILCVTHGDTVYFHLGAYDATGYRRNTSYALVLTIIEHFTQAGMRRMSIGAGAGAFAREHDGLTQFKRGWASGTRMTYLCGHVQDRQAFDRLCRAEKSSDPRYFPAYRASEFS